MIVRPRSQSRIPREVADRRQFSCGCCVKAATSRKRLTASTRSGFLGAMRPTAGGPGGRHQLEPRRLRMKMAMKKDDDGATARQSESKGPTGNLNLNRKTAGQPFSYSRFKCSGPCGCPRGRASTSPTGFPRSMLRVIAHVEGHVEELQHPHAWKSP